MGCNNCLNTGAGKKAHICSPQGSNFSPALSQSVNLTWAGHIKEQGDRAGAPSDHSQLDWH